VIVRRGVVIACVLALVSEPALVRARAGAGPASDAPAPTTDEDPTLAEAKAHHVEADAKYNTADYEGAIASWRKAYAALPRTHPEANYYRALIAYNIAASYEKLYAVRGDVEHLRQAKILLQKFEASIDETYSDVPDEGVQVRAEVRAKIAHIDELLAKAEHEPKPKAPTTRPQDRTTTPVKPTEKAPADRDPSRGLVVGGGVLIGLGVVGGAGMTAALVVGGRANDIGDIDDADVAARKETFDRGRAANTGAIAAGVVGLACLAAGIALVVVGVKRRPARTTASFAGLRVRF
jgi:hypothetical protein